MAAENQTSEETQLSQRKTIKVYKRRWVILLIYILYSAANSFQWMEYSIISSIVTKFYNVTPVQVNWSSIIYMIIYPIIVIPVSYIIEKKGLRVAALIGGLGTALAAFIKVFSATQNAFYILLIGQAIGSTAQVFVLCLPTKIAAVWFKANEVSTACSLAVFGTQLGFALGFILPSTIVGNHDDSLMVKSDLNTLCWGLTIYMIPVSMAIIFSFPSKPSLPPSITQANAHDVAPKNFKKYVSHFMKVFKNPGFTLHTIAYGINIGVFAAIGTFLNEFILYYFPNCEADAGRIGLLMVVGGMIGSVCFGLFLDKTHKFKETTVFIYFMAVLSIVGSMFALSPLKNKILVYILFTIVGIFTNAYMPVGFELAVEITYPADESTTAGILNAMTQAVGVIITLGLGKLNEAFGPFWSLASQAALLLIGAIFTTLVPNKKLRQAAFANKSNIEILLQDKV